MKRKHRIPPQAYFVSDEITPEYQAEVDATMAQAEVRFAAAERRLATAQAKLARVEQSQRSLRRNQEILVAREIVELRRQELLDLQRQMSRYSASATHRGNGSRKRSVPGMSVL